MNKAVRKIIMKYYKQMQDTYGEKRHKNKEDRQKELFAAYTHLLNKKKSNINEDFIVDSIFLYPESRYISSRLIDILSKNTSTQDWSINVFRMIELKFSHIEKKESAWIQNIVLDSVLTYHDNLPPNTLHYLYNTAWIDEWRKIDIKENPNYHKWASMIIEEIEKERLI